MSNAPQQPAAPPPPQPGKPMGDTTLAMLAHVLMIVGGFIPPLIIWLVKKDEDKYVAFHGKQALCWSVAVTVVTAVMAGTVVLLVLVPFVLVANLVYVIIAGVRASQLQPFKYLLVADWFCKREFAEAYPGLGGEVAPPSAAPPPPPAAPPPEEKASGD